MPAWSAKKSLATGFPFRASVRSRAGVETRQRWNAGFRTLVGESFLPNPSLDRDTALALPALCYGENVGRHNFRLSRKLYLGILWLPTTIQAPRRLSREMDLLATEAWMSAPAVRLQKKPRSQDENSRCSRCPRCQGNKRSKLNFTSSQNPPLKQTQSRPDADLEAPDRL